MHTGYRYVGSFFLAAALITPTGIIAARQPDEHRQEEHHDKDKSVGFASEAPLS